MATRRIPAFRKAIAKALLARDRLEIKAIERVLAAANLDPRRGPAGGRRPRHRLAP